MKRSETKGSRPSGKDSSKERFREIGRGTSQIVQHAAQLLDEELAAGIVAAKQVHQRFAKDQRIDPRDFKTALQKFQTDSHDVISLLSDQLAAFRSDENNALMRQFVDKSHDLLDLAIDMVSTSAAVANQLIAKADLKRTKASDDRQPGA